MQLTRAIALAAAFALGCAASGGGDDASSAGPSDPCVPGQSIACTCEGGSGGAQICDPDGIGYSACSCDDDAGSDGESSETGADDADPDTDGAEAGTMPATGEPDDDSGATDGVPSWTNDIVPLLAASCGAGVNGCHSREAYNAEVDKGCLNWVSFEDVLLGAVHNSGDKAGEATGCPDLPLYERIVDRSPWQCGAFFNAPTAVLIKPYDPEGSYVIQKINGFTCDDGTAMPPPESGIAISDADLAMLTEWIALGAPYDG